MKSRSVNLSVCMSAVQCLQFSLICWIAQVGSAGGAIESKNNNSVSDLVVDSCVEELSVQHCFLSAGWTEHQQDNSPPPQHKPRDGNTNVEFNLSPWVSFKQPGCKQTSGEHFFFCFCHHFLLIGHSFFSDTPLFYAHKDAGTVLCGMHKPWTVTVTPSGCSEIILLMKKRWQTAGSVPPPLISHEEGEELERCCDSCSLKHAAWCCRVSTPSFVYHVI